MEAMSDEVNSSPPLPPTPNFSFVWCHVSCIPSLLSWFNLSFWWSISPSNFLKKRKEEVHFIVLELVS
jgi:hypothetical protein